LPGIRVPGHKRTDSPDLHCLCGWRAPAGNRRIQREAYSAHLATERAKRYSSCRDCGEQKTPSLLSKARPGVCKPCSNARTRAWAEANPEEWDRAGRKSHLKIKYGLTLEQYDEMLADQGGVCAICKRSAADSRGYRMHIDHCHSTGVVRGILCVSCNLGIGSFRDDPDRCEAAAQYLRTPR
jgi:hypothetical protein